jgi:hypothetical protein
VDAIEVRLAVGRGLSQALRANGSRFGFSAFVAILPSSASSAGGKWIRLRPETFAA